MQGTANVKLKRHGGWNCSKMNQDTCNCPLVWRGNVWKRYPETLDSFKVYRSSRPNPQTWTFHWDCTPRDLTNLKKLELRDIGSHSKLEDFGVPCQVQLEPLGMWTCCPRPCCPRLLRMQMLSCGLTSCSKIHRQFQLQNSSGFYGEASSYIAVQHIAAWLRETPPFCQSADVSPCCENYHVSPTAFRWTCDDCEAHDFCNQLLVDVHCTVFIIRCPMQSVLPHPIFKRQPVQCWCTRLLLLFLFVFSNSTSSWYTLRTLCTLCTLRTLRNYSSSPFLSWSYCWGA